MSLRSIYTILTCTVHSSFHWVLHQMTWPPFGVSPWARVRQELVFRQASRNSLVARTWPYRILLPCSPCHHREPRFPLWGAERQQKRPISSKWDRVRAVVRRKMPTSVCLWKFIKVYEFTLDLWTAKSSPGLQCVYEWTERFNNSIVMAAEQRSTVLLNIIKGYPIKLLYIGNEWITQNLS